MEADSITAQRDPPTVQSNRPDPHAIAVLSSNQHVLQRADERASVEDLERYRLLQGARVQSYRNSPVRDTPECMNLLAILREAGLDEGAVPEVYFAVWDVSERFLVDQNNARHRLAQWKRHLSIEFGLTNRAVLDKLFAVKPKAPWGSPLRFSSSN